MTAPFPYATVPRLFPESTIAVIANGPSLTQADVDLCRARVPIVAVKDAIRLAPDAAVLYGGDRHWWKHHGPSLTYSGLRYVIEQDLAQWGQVLKNTGMVGLETQPHGLRTGHNSGYQAINVAVHLGATRIVLLGFDMKPTEKGKHHWFGMHPYHRNIPPYDIFKRSFQTIVEPLKALGIRVLNASRQTDLTCFPRVPLKEALA